MKLFLSMLLIWLTVTSALAFDQRHQGFDALLKKHVSWDAQGVASTVDYGGFQQDEALLKEYLAQVSEVVQNEFDSWRKSDQLAFLINAYNGFTIQLILTRYPDLTSIKDLGSLFSSPWSQSFFRLLGKQRSLDNIEHDLIRAPGIYDDPRIHSAVVCASIGCPGLRNEAFSGDQLEQQLEDSLRRFLSDKSRNRYNPEKNRLEISKIFDWYGNDFSSGFRGHSSLISFLADYAEILAKDSRDRQLITSGKATVDFLDYDWRLNKTSPLSP
jgi:hypothetical protein